MKEDLVFSLFVVAAILVYGFALKMATSKTFNVAL